MSSWTKKFAFTNSVNPDQINPTEAVWSGSTMFASQVIIYLADRSKYKLKMGDSIFEVQGVMGYQVDFNS